MSERRADASQGSDSAPPEVALSIHIEASADTVWGILSGPEPFSAWMGGQVSFETRVGSPYRARFPQYRLVLAGEVLDFDDLGRRFALSWGIESGPQAETMPAASSRVEFRVNDGQGGAHVEVRHSGFLSARTAREHEDGWRFHLGRLALSANRTDLAAGLARALPAWWAAWNEPDEAARLKSLRACCAPDLEFRDDWAVLRGIERLSLHIANCHRFMPGWRIEPTGDVRVCRGEALVGWRSSAQGQAAQEGFNHVRADYDGTLRRVAGFQAAG